jgi:uncharacterized membrane protein
MTNCECLLTINVLAHRAGIFIAKFDPFGVTPEGNICSTKSLLWGLLFKCIYFLKIFQPYRLFCNLQKNHTSLLAVIILFVYQRVP